MEVAGAKVFLYCCTVSHRSESVAAPTVAKRIEKGMIVKKSMLVWVGYHSWGQQALLKKTKVEVPLANLGTSRPEKAPYND